MPNITGHAGWIGETSYQNRDGALFISEQYDESFHIEAGSMTGRGWVCIDASRSSEVYGKSNTVQPKSRVVYIYRRIA